MVESFCKMSVDSWKRWTFVFVAWFYCQKEYPNFLFRKGIIKQVWQTPILHGQMSNRLKLYYIQLTHWSRAFWQFRKKLNSSNVDWISSKRHFFIMQMQMMQKVQEIMEHLGVLSEYKVFPFLYYQQRTKSDCEDSDSRWGVVKGGEFYTVSNLWLLFPNCSSWSKW